MDIMALKQEEVFLNGVLESDIRVIDDNTRFWMIRTKKGYFYNEFISNDFIALAWNTITSDTDFSEAALDALKDQILLNYEEIKRPTTVINKCKSFIHDVKPGDYIVIPSAGSGRITIALAGEYYEEAGKTYEIEKEVISRIEKKDVLINEVSCPYRKRRRIIPLLTVKSSDVDGKLYKAISNYHGISNFDDYWRNILGLLYDVYSFKGNLNVVYHIGRMTPIGPRMLSKLLWAAADCWCGLVDEDKISAQVSVASPGPVDFEIVGLLPELSEAVKLLVGLTIGTLSIVKPESIPTFLKSLFSLPAEVTREYVSAKREKLQLEKEQQMLPLEIEEKQLDLLEKKLTILDKLKEFGVDTKQLETSAVGLAETFGYLQIESNESHLTALPSDDENELDELLEEEIAEEETAN